MKFEGKCICATSYSIICFHTMDSVAPVISFLFALQVFDPTEIRARPALRRNLKEFLAYGAVHVASFFLIMNSLVHDLTALAEL